jgi:hypothetical protein
LGRVPDFRFLEETLLAAGETLRAMTGDGPAKKEVLKDVFRINHEMGRIAREFPTLAPGLREMQLEVNSMTIQIKREEVEGAMAAFARVSSCLRKVRETQTAPEQS